MSKKQVNWNANAKPVHSPKLVPGQYASYSELLAKAHKREMEVEKANRIYKAISPRLKAKLLDRMINRQPIEVRQPFEVVVEKLSKSEAGAEFVHGTDVVPKGAQLTFDHIQQTTHQWIFKSEAGAEYEIYDKPQIMVDNGSVVQNAGYFGLMTHTDIYEEVLNELGNSKDKD